MITEFLPNHTSIDTAYVVSDYPWGFRLRTQQRHWIETTSHGDRHVVQTLNPKTGRWCNPKMSTYSDVMVLGLNEEGHVSTYSLSINASPEWQQKFIEATKDYPFTDHQRMLIKRVGAWEKTMSHFTFTCEASPYNPINLTKVMQGDPEEVAKAKAEEERQEARKQEDKKMVQTMNGLMHHYMNQ